MSSDYTALKERLATDGWHTSMEIEMQRKDALAAIEALESEKETAIEQQMYWVAEARTLRAEVERLENELEGLRSVVLTDELLQSRLREESLRARLARYEQGEVVEGSVVESEPEVKWHWRPWYDGMRHERRATLIIHPEEE